MNGKNPLKEACRIFTFDLNSSRYAFTIRSLWEVHTKKKVLGSFEGRNKIKIPVARSIFNFNILYKINSFHHRFLQVMGPGPSAFTSRSCRNYLFEGLLRSSGDSVVWA
ncbi:hypothetical protein JYU34_022513 [Plutella xylostella]|uniref:Uncharacterized protein n=1 Tax=Plutella xylostella TaxID=51655 RepID=A0ABQ7PTS9_PLUXY|nr:hypothetical protein JYU34_022513 [Plutella xylostella]